MSAPNVPRLAVFVLLLALAGVIGLAIMQYQRLGEARRRIDRLEGRVNDLLDARGAAGGGGADAAASLDELKRADEDLGRRIDTLLLRTVSNTKRLDSVEAGNLDELGLEEFVEQKIGQTLGQGQRLASRRPEIDRVAEYLGLSDRQRTRIADIIDRSKDEVWKLMQDARADGSNLSASLAEALNAPTSPEQKKKAMADQLFNHGPPGSADSYFTHMMEIRTGALDDFQGTLTAEQQARWKGMGLDPFAIQTGYTPFKKAVQEVVEGTP
jgi:hypothetical protein